VKGGGKTPVLDQQVRRSLWTSLAAAVIVGAMFGSFLAAGIGFVVALAVIEITTLIREEIEMARGTWPPEEEREEIERIGDERRAKLRKVEDEMAADAERRAEEKRLRRYRKEVKKRKRREGRGR
jgi:hypothetical protein